MVKEPKYAYLVFRMVDTENQKDYHFSLYLINELAKNSLKEAAERYRDYDGFTWVNENEFKCGNGKWSIRYWIEKHPVIGPSSEDLVERNNDEETD